MKPLTLALVSVEPDDVTEFRRVFGKLLSQLSAEWRLVDAEPADLAVVDIDSIYGHMDWLRLTGGGARTAVYTSAQYTEEWDLVVTKPLDRDELRRVLDAVAAEHGVRRAPAARPPEPAATSAPVPVAHVEPVAAPEPVIEPAAPADTPMPVAAEPPAEPAPIPEEPASVEPATVGDWLRAGPDRAVRISVERETWNIDPERNVYYGPAELRALAPALSRPVDSLAALEGAALEAARKAEAQPVARLRWYAGLLESPGRLGAGLDPEGSFHLDRWPQIEREFPRHFRVATAMMKEAGTVAQLALTSGVPEAEVADFINACRAIGLLGAPAVAEEDPGPRRRGVMSRLRRGR